MIMKSLMNQSLGMVRRNKAGKLKSKDLIAVLKAKPLPVPKSIQHEIQQKVAVLSPTSKQLLEALCVLNSETTLPSLGAFTNKSGDDLTTAIQELKRYEWIRVGQKDKSKSFSARQIYQR